MRDPAALRAFAKRDWGSFARAPHVWGDLPPNPPGETVRSGEGPRDPGAGVLIGDELRRHALAVKGPSALSEGREGDYATHLRVIEALRSVPPRRR